MYAIEYSKWKEINSHLSAVYCIVEKDNPILVITYNL